MWIEGKSQILKWTLALSTLLLIWANISGRAGGLQVIRKRWASDKHTDLAEEKSIKVVKQGKWLQKCRC